MKFSIISKAATSLKKLQLLQQIWLRNSNLAFVIPTIPIVSKDFLFHDAKLLTFIRFHNTLK